MTKIRQSFPLISFQKCALVFALGSSLCLSTVPSARADSDLGQDMLTCRTISEISQRVACYDAIADQLKVLHQAGEALSHKLSPPQTTPQSSPNASNTLKPNPQNQSMAQKLLETFGLKEKEGEKISQTVRKIKFGPQKQFMITTESGQVWLQSGPQKVKLPKRLPFDIFIERGAMGSYFLNAKGQSTQYKVRRIK